VLRAGADDRTTPALILRVVGVCAIRCGSPRRSGGYTKKYDQHTVDLIHQGWRRESAYVGLKFEVECPYNNAVGFGQRIYVLDRNRLQRISFDAWIRLWRGEQRCESYAGRAVQFVILYLQFRNRRPFCLQKASFNLVQFGDNGFVDRARMEEALALIASQGLRPIRTDPSSSIVGFHHFAARRLEREFHWQPTEQELALIIRAVKFST
jgi:hypothetical protein